jgi:hypothetical protein
LASGFIPKKRCLELSSPNKCWTLERLKVPDTFFLGSNGETLRRRLQIVAQLPTSQRTIERQGIELREGTTLTLYSDDANDEGQPDELLADAVVHYNRWASPRAIPCAW